jgi:hypothetical protein
MSTDTPAARPDRRAIRILARSIARDFEAHGHEARVLVMLASELIEEASQRLRRRSDD